MRKIFTNGVFDLFHEGHYHLLRKAKAEGDFLLVGVASDESCAKSKRPPIEPWEKRARKVLEAPFVDEVIKTPWSVDLTEAFYADHGISLQVQGDQGSSFGVAEKLGILKIVGRTDGISTTKLLDILKAEDAEILEGGYLNDVKRVLYEGSYFVVKYAQRTVGRLYPIPLPDHRTRDEYDVIVAFHKHMGSPGFIVKPLYSDREKIIIFDSAPVEAETLFVRLLREEMDESLLTKIVESLAGMHNASLDNGALRDRFSSNRGFLEIKVDLQCRQATGDAALRERIGDFMDRSMRIQRVLLHGDFAPKNILVWGRAQYLFIDFEESGYGDPALDVGYFFAHLYLHRELRGAGGGEEMLGRLLAAYLAVFSGADPGLVARINGFIGIFLISRLDSRAPAKYVPESLRERIRSMAVPLILGETRLSPWPAASEEAAQAPARQAR